MRALYSDVVILQQDAHPLDLRKFAHDLAVDPRNGLEAARPVVFVVRPGDPGGFVRFPLGGHAEAELRGAEFGVTTETGW